MVSSKSLTLTVALLATSFSTTSAFPEYLPTAQVAGRQDDATASSSGLSDVYPEKPPGPLVSNGTKLVNDAAHPWNAPTRRGHERPMSSAQYAGIARRESLSHFEMHSMLISTQYLPRNGVATPVQLINAVQEGFNMENKAAIFVTYAAMLADGNLLTNTISIGGKTKKTGPSPPAPALAGGLSQAGLGVEGDASLIRGDAAFGDNHSFNATLFEEFKDFSNRLGGGYYNLTVAAEYRWHSIQRSIATNPNFTFVAPRCVTAYSESALIIDALVDGRSTERRLDMDAALGCPRNFYRAPQPVGGNELAAQIFMAHPTVPGRNTAGVNSYTPDPTSASIADFCGVYSNFVNRTVRELYPNPTGLLERNLILNLEYIYLGTPSAAGCEQLFPYGQL
ncbi:hypothetical protein DFP72DRAFT_926815 [Ephemerocybe angulata]|uniref:Heme haloperoxidase family profile domain-containing protein n=1 Tax=Ephemerocybe angulata TaxID=980116 RepID=A0A8H6LWB5_9AGAR|nr:hypothetical protein DFP72DRAFT_926815 [Tulosesus angulatus]